MKRVLRPTLLAWRPLAVRMGLSGAAIVLAVLVKVAGETPWGEPLRRSEGWDIAVAPLAHATGALAGLLCAAVADALWRLQRRRGD